MTGSEHRVSEYQYALQHAYTEPDIYFDEDEEPEEIERGDDIRLVIATIVDASRGSTKRLQAIMCLFAGLSLREAATVCGRSHEYVRKTSLGIKESHPALYSVLTHQVRGTVKAIIPNSNQVGYAVEDITTGKSVCVRVLTEWSRKMRINHNTVKSAYRRGYVLNNRYRVSKLG